MKTVDTGTRPTSNPSHPSDADARVDSRSDGDDQEKMKRLTIDVPASLHRAIKTSCAMRGAKMTDEIRELLQQKYGKHVNLIGV